MGIILYHVYDIVIGLIGDIVSMDENIMILFHYRSIDDFSRVVFDCILCQKDFWETYSMISKKWLYPYWCFLSAFVMIIFDYFLFSDSLICSCLSEYFMGFAVSCCSFVKIYGIDDPWIFSFSLTYSYAFTFSKRSWGKISEIKNIIYYTFWQILLFLLKHYERYFRD